MKTHFHQRQNNKTGLSFLKVAIFLLLLGVCFLLFSKVLSGKSEAFLSTTLSRAGEIRTDYLNRVSNTLFASFNTKKSLVEENKKLQRELREKDTLVFYSQTLKHENQRLRGLLSLGYSPGKVTGKVIAKPPFTKHDVLWVSVGGENRISIGNLVYAPGPAVIGEVVSLEENYLEVDLFSSSGNSIRTLSPTGEEVVINGIGGGNFAVELPKGTEVKKGDVFVLPTQSNIPFAVVGSVEEDAANPFSKILLHTPANVFTLTEVFVDIDGNQ